MREIITSSSNSIVKLIRKVHDRKRGDDLVYIEGSRIVEDCLMSGGECAYLIASSRKMNEAVELASGYGIADSQIFILSDDLFERISSTVNCRKSLKAAGG